MSSLPLDPTSHAHSMEGHHDYNFSGTIYNEYSDNGPSTDDEQLLHQHSLLQSAPSRHSSVSSFPASVVHHTPTGERPSTPSRSTFLYTRATTPNYSPRPHSTGFRHPSSVRALQMQDEFDTTDCEELTPGHRRRNSKLSYLSHRSSGSHNSSPVKSLRMRGSAHSSPSKSKLKQEFPLVLLHCTLLPPALTARANLLGSEANDKESILEAIIPEPYVKYWKTLQDKVVKNAEVKSRGVLIPHPRDEYELLEERLFESLELERPKIRDGHYLGSEKSENATDSGFESGGTDTDSLHEAGQADSNNTSAEQCPDCGHKLSSGVEQQRKWEVKVFAANGLMRAGAWGAAWNEMEKIDVEVSVWMPEHIRREVDARLEALIAKETEEKPKKEKRRRGMDDERAKEIYGETNQSSARRGRSQAEIDGLVDVQSTRQSTPEVVKPAQTHQQHHVQPDVATMLGNYIRLLAQDRRNIAILLLSMLVMFYGFTGGKNVGQSSNTLSVTKPLDNLKVPDVSIQILTDTAANKGVPETPTVIVEASHPPTQGVVESVGTSQASGLLLENDAEPTEVISETAIDESRKEGVDVSQVADSASFVDTSPNLEFVDTQSTSHLDAEIDKPNRLEDSSTPYVQLSQEDEELQPAEEITKDDIESAEL